MKAQLILVGGRSLPNMLTILYQKPDVVVAIYSHQSFIRDWPGLKHAIEALVPSCAIRESDPVDGFDLVQIQQRCQDELLRWPNASWLFNITTATTIMSIAAYEIVREYSNKMSVSWCYLDTARTRVIPENNDSISKAVYSIGVRDYMTAYNYGVQEGTSLKLHRVRYLQDDLLNMAKLLGEDVQKASLLKQIMKGWHGSPKQGRDSNGVEFTKQYRVPPEVSIEAHGLLQTLEDVGMIKKIQRKQGELYLTLTEQQYKFFDGAWLELYVYQTARAQGEFFDDCQWSKEIIDNDPVRQAKSVLQYNELDVSLTYKAQLLVLECKTGNAGLDTKTLDDIVTLADLVGGRFVGKFLITNQWSTKEADPDFFTKADRKGVHVVVGQDLPKLSAILRDQTINPKYPRT